MPRKTDYERKGGELEEIEGLSGKLTEDLRKRVHLIKSCPVLSEDWCLMADLVGRIARISDVEAALPKDDAKETLWEGEELALKYVMEDGKLNLCLRLLGEFREYKDCGAVGYTQTGSEAKASGDAQRRRERLDGFEKGMGVLLRNAWDHDEAVQTTDLPLLISHVADVLKDACKPEGAKRVSDRAAAGDLAERQEVCVLHYLRHLCLRADELRGQRFMALIQDSDVVERAVAFLDMHGEKLPEADALVAAQALSELFDTEEFQTYEERYLPGAAADKLATFRVRLLEPFLDDYDKRKTIQPLLRFIQDCNYK